MQRARRGRCLGGVPESKGEEWVGDAFRRKGFSICYQYTKDGFDGKRFDVYCPRLNTIVEYDGEQHFSYGRDRDFVRTWRELHEQRRTDILKTALALESGLSIFRIDDAIIGGEADIDRIVNMIVIHAIRTDKPILRCYTFPRVDRYLMLKHEVGRLVNA